MIKYRIYTVEEVENELRDIQRAILCNSQKESEIAFENININDFENEESIAAFLLNAISEKKTNLIIIDYKLNSRNKSFDGNQIFNELSNQVPLFPAIILTNRPEECADQFIVDSDKIYRKASLIKIDSDLSKELVSKLFHNVDLYSKRLREFEDIEREIERNCDQESNIKKIIECDEKMSKLIPGSNTVAYRKLFNEEFFDKFSEELQEAANAIRDFNEKK